MTTKERFLKLKFQSLGWYATSLVTLLLLAALLGVGWVYQKAAFENQLAAQIAELDENLSNQIAAMDEKQTQLAAELSKQLAEVEQKLSAAQLAASQKVHDPSFKSDDNTVWLSDKVFQDRLKDGSLGPKMAMLPSNTFRMGDIQGGGSSNEQPVHDVSLDGFAMGVYEVTVAEFRQFVNATQYKTDAEKKGSCYSYANGSKWVDGLNWRNPGFSQDETHPVVCVSWNDTKAYTDWLTKQTGHQYRLPTEAEWEYAARAGTTTQYWWGNQVGTNNANCRNDQCGDSYQYTAQVGSFAANPFGLYDTAGNTWEWTCSEYEDPYRGKEQRCADNAGRFARHGGSWLNDATRTRSAARYWNGPANRIDSDGFRLARIK